MNATNQAIVPVPRVAVSIRDARLADLPFIDELQKQHTKQVGWMPTAQLEGKIKLGHVLIAEEATERLSDEATEGTEDAAAAPFVAPSLRRSTPSPLGYIIGNDQYFKRDDVGIIYQVNVAPVHHRSLIGAALVKALFERAAYGCKLFCCWCAQDIEANYFWESLGFVPLAFRTGSRTRGPSVASSLRRSVASPRIHIFWQKRIRQGDGTTPYWFPSQTTSGSIREDRLVLPIPPGTHWRDVMPIVLPGVQPGEVPALPAPAKRRRPKHPTPKIDVRDSRWRGLRIGPGAAQLPAEEKPKPAPKPKVKNDPKLVAAARELRDRWMEHVTANPAALTGAGKYDVARAVQPPARIALPGALAA